MIISKDLFIFGEQIFATIIPEGGSTQGSQQQQQQQQQQQLLTQHQQAAIINTLPQTAGATPTAASFTVPLAAEQVQVSSQKKATPTTGTTSTPTTTTVAPSMTKPPGKQETVAIMATNKKAKHQKIPKETEELKGKRKEKQQLQQQLQQKGTNIVDLNGGAKLYAKKTPSQPLPLPPPTTPATQLADETQKHLEAALTKATASPAAVAVREPELEPTTEEAEREPLVKRNLTRILTAATVITPPPRPQTPAISADDTGAGIEATFTNLAAKQRERDSLLLPPPSSAAAPGQSSDYCLQVEVDLTSSSSSPIGAAAIATTGAITPTASAATTPPPTPITGLTADQNSQEHIAHAEHLSLNMDKVMLANNARNDHAMVNFPFVPELHRTIQMTFQNVTVLHKDRKILSDISGLVSPGEVLAIMGPSGCGKTTLLDCLSGQRHVDGGSIYLNREPISKKWRRKICYVLQEEIFFSGLTLRETVMYTALLRLPEKMPKAEKTQLVDRILETLELNFCQQTKFGDYLNRGLSGGEKKRANIACELLTNPLLMLLDEPTSGLDSHSAISLMKVLKRYAMQEQKTVVITVHQPSSQMFHMFDKLLLLYNGRTAYFGEVNNIYQYFEDIGVAIKPHYNPADFVLEQLKSYPDIREKLFVAAKESHGNFLNRNCITGNHQHHTISHHQHHNHQNGNHQNGSIGVTTTNGTTDAFGTPADVGVKDKSHQHDTLINDIIKNYYKDIQNNHNHNHHHDAMLMMSNHHDSCEEAAQHLWCGADSHSNFSSASSDCHQQYENANDWLDYPTRFHTQFHVLSSRNFKEAKPRMLSKLNWFQTIGLALMAGAIWFQIPRTEEFLHDLQGWMFFSQTYWMLFALFGALNSFPSEREVISKERRSGAYRLSAYYLAKMFGELPLVITLPTVYLIISYPMLGCSSFKLFFLMLIFLLLNTIVAQSVGFFIGACCMDMNVSITLSALYTLATQLFGGYLSSRIPDGLSWIRYTSMIHYAYQNMQILEFREGPAIRCGKPSSYEICKNSSTIFIPYEEILKAQNSNSPLWLNTLILMMFFMVFRGLGYAVLRYVRCPKT